MNIRQVQTALNKWFAHRHIPISVDVDGVMGPQTGSAIRELKLCCGFAGKDTNAVIGPKTRRILGLRQPPYVMVNPAQIARALSHRKFLRRQGNNPRARVLAFAKKFVGIKENPAGSNCGNPYPSGWERRLGFGCVAWCGIFCANMLLHVGVQGVTSALASVDLIEDEARQGKGPFHAWTDRAAQARQGDLVVLFGRGVHVELVDRIDFAAGLLYTVGGNTSSGVAGSQSNGGMVAARVRSLNDVHGFALVNY